MIILFYAEKLIIRHTIINIFSSPKSSIIARHHHELKSIFGNSFHFDMLKMFKYYIKESFWDMYFRNYVLVSVCFKVFAHYKTMKTKDFLRTHSHSNLP